MDVLNRSLWQQRSHQHETRARLWFPDPTSQMQLNWVRKLEGSETLGTRPLPAPPRETGPTQEPACEGKGSAGGMTHCPGPGARRPAPEAEVIACKSHPWAFRAPQSHRAHLCTASGARPSPAAQSLALLCVGPSAGTLVLRA